MTKEDIQTELYEHIVNLPSGGGEVWREAANERKRVRESEREEGERERFKR